jgi:hypothetical protein
MLYLIEPDDLGYINEKIEYNPEKTFSSIKLNELGTELDSKLLREIDQSSFAGNCEIKDRFGRNLTLSEISTGCKCAISVAHFPDKLIDTVECGINARDAIIRNIRNGKMLYYYDVTPNFYAKDMKIDVCVFNDNTKYRITSAKRLSYYLDCERGLSELTEDEHCIKIGRI